jgi:phenylacetate-CoA ligase
MDPSYEAKRLIDVARVVRLSRKVAAEERLPRERLEQLQRERLEALVRHAAAHSPYYRERIDPDTPVELTSLPVLDKQTLMERFDDVVCDRRLRRDALLEHLDGLDHDALYLGRYRVMTTSGSCGQKSLYVYDRPAWRVIGAMYMRFSAWAGATPRVPRLRMAMIGGGSPTHMSRRGAATLSVGVHKTLPLAVTMPLDRLVAALNGFRPQYVFTYPSMAVLLAGEQEAGQLRIAPESFATSSELCTPGMAARIEAAFGVRPFDLYATTEGLWGGSCGQGRGMHLFENVALVENVDAQGRPVPPGERGARVLVTSLFNRVQPLIRFEVSDLVTIDPEPCACGRTLLRIRGIEGRADDVLQLPGDGGTVAVHPLQFEVVTADRQVREFQVVQAGSRLRLRVALREDAPRGEAIDRLRERVAGRLAALGVREPAVDVETCAGIERPEGGKLKLIVADRSGAPGT